MGSKWDQGGLEGRFHCQAWQTNIHKLKPAVIMSGWRLHCCLTGTLGQVLCFLPITRRGGVLWLEPRSSIRFSGYRLPWLKLLLMVVKVPAVWSKTHLIQGRLAWSLHKDDTKLMKCFIFSLCLNLFVFCTGQYPLCYFVVIKQLEVFREERAVYALVV